MFRKNSFIRGALCCLLIWCLAIDPVAFAWDPVAHYFIAKEAAAQKGSAPSGVEDYANLPDYEASAAQSGFLWLTRATTPYFCWSHGVQSNGTTSTDTIVGCPIVPTYPDDGRYPGLVMKDLVVSKLKSLHGRPSNDPLLIDMQNTVNGFRVHNAADRQVHWSFFMGATTSMQDPYLRGQAWTVHHGCKEAWADYEVLIQKAFGGNSTAAFTASGSIATTSSIPNGIGFRGNAQLMYFAQEAYRKNGYAIDAANTTRLTPQTVGEIQTALTTGEAATIRNWLQQTNWAVWEAVGVKVVCQGSFVWMDQNNVPHTISTATPANNQAEYTLLCQLRDWTVQQNFNDWRTWNQNVLDAKYSASVNDGAAWMVDFRTFPTLFWGLTA